MTTMVPTQDLTNDDLRKLIRKLEEGNHEQVDFLTRFLAIGSRTERRKYWDMREGEKLPFAIQITPDEDYGGDETFVRLKHATEEHLIAAQTVETGATLAIIQDLQKVLKPFFTDATVTVEEAMQRFRTKAKTA